MKGNLFDWLQGKKNRVTNSIFFYNWLSFSIVKTINRAQEIESGRTLEVHSDQPGVQFYTANFLPDKEPLPGKEGAKYFKHGAFCLETQNYPDAINHVRISWNSSIFSLTLCEQTY